MPDLPDAVILCGGAGTRLRSVTGDGPKSMATVAGRPFLELLLRQLCRYGFRRVILAVGYRQEVIREHFGNSALGLNVAYSSEASPLGTGGALRNAADLVRSETVLIMNGDSYIDANLAELVADHMKAQADLSLVVNPPDGRGDCGSVYVNPQGFVERFAEKQYSSRAPFVNAGIYMVARRLLLEVPAGVPISLEQDLFPRWLQEGRSLKASVAFCRCIDIGTPDRFQSAQDLLAAVERESSLPDCEG